MSFVTQGVALKPINLVCLLNHCFRLSQVISLTPPMKKQNKTKPNIRLLPW